MEMLTELNAWHWAIMAAILIVLEMFAPGAFMLWLGIAAAIVSLLLVIFPGMGWETQFVIFAVLAVVSIIAWRAVQKRHPVETDQPTLNRRGEQYVGRVFTVNEDIINGQGKINVDDSTWKIVGSDCASGTQVKVIGVDGVVLKVDIIG